MAPNYVDQLVNKIHVFPPPLMARQPL